MATTIVTKSGSGAPTASDLVAGELAVDLTNGRLYTEDSGGTVLELGLNPSGNVDVTGSVTADGLTAVNATDTQGKFSGWAVTGANSSSGAIELGQNAAYQGIMSYAADGNTRFLFDNTYGSTGSTFEFRTNTAATAKTHLKIEGSGDISFYEDTGTTPKLFWDASAESLGIGTSSVATKLHVMGNSTVRNTLVSTLTLDTGTSASNPFAGFGTGIDFKGEDYSSAVRNYGGIYSIMTAQSSSTTPAGDAGFESSLTFYTNTGGASGTNPTEKVRIDSSGNLLVGTTSTVAGGKISVQAVGTNPAIAVQGASDCFQGRTTQTSGTSYFAYWVYNGSNVGSITSTGSSTAYNTSSDQRLKENIADADDAGSKIDSIQVRQYDWKADGSHQDYGMVAQELQLVAPEAVTGDADSEEMMGVDYSKLVPMLIKEIQSLRNRIAALES